jgi:hypothetical protein
VVAVFLNSSVSLIPRHWINAFGNTIKSKRVEQDKEYDNGDQIIHKAAVLHFNL